MAFLTDDLRHIAVGVSQKLCVGLNPQGFVEGAIMNRRVALLTLLGVWEFGLGCVFAGDGLWRQASKETHRDNSESVRESFLQRWFRRRDGQWEQEFSAYQVGEGDLVFFQTNDPTWQNIFAAGGSPGPTHVGLVVRGETGRLGLLQALDPQFKLKGMLKWPGATPGRVCWTPDVVGYLEQYPGKVWVRRHRAALPATVSQRLTAWAKRQLGKPYGLAKILHPPLGLPIQTTHLGGPARVEGDSWICSELVASALVVTRHFSHWHVRPSRVDPEDLFSDRLLNLKPAWEPPLRWSSRTDETPVQLTR